MINICLDNQTVNDKCIVNGQAQEGHDDQVGERGGRVQEGLARSDVGDDAADNPGECQLVRSSDAVVRKGRGLVQGK